MDGANKIRQDIIKAKNALECYKIFLDKEEGDISDENYKTQRDNLKEDLDDLIFSCNKFTRLQLETSEWKKGYDKIESTEWGKGDSVNSVPKV